MTDVGMTVAITVILGAVLVWSWVARRADGYRITMPLVLVAAGASISWQASAPIIGRLDQPIVERAVEVVLALRLFLDATEMAKGWRRDLREVLRLLLIGVPLALLGTILAAQWIYPDLTVFMALLLACILVPTDLTPAGALLSSDTFPRRPRDLIKSESGYNDGIVSPLFLFALAMISAGQGQRSSPDPYEVLGKILPDFGWVLLFGGVLGGVCGLIARWTVRHGWSDVRSLELAGLAIPLLAYAIAVGAEGSGFVAAFVAGLAYRAVFGPEVIPTLDLTEDVSRFTIAALWFVFGQLLAYVLTLSIDWQAVALAVCSLTVCRILPVCLALLGSPVRWRERLAIGWMGPRGIASIVFALLALREVGDDKVALMMQVMVWTVALSVVLHGITATVLSHHRESREPLQSGQPQDPESDSPTTVRSV